MLRHMNKESIDRFSTGNWNERKASPSYGNFGTLADGDIGLEIRNEIIFKIAAKKVAKSSRASANDLQLLTIVVPGVELHPRAQIVEITVPANMVPMAMSHKYRRQGGEVGDAMSQELVSGLGRIGPGASVDGYQLLAVLRHDEVILGELKTRQIKDLAGNDFS